MKAISLFGLTGSIMYLLHIFFGRLFYETYNPLTQAVSDLTAANSPSKIISVIFFALYGIFATMFFAGFWINFKRKNHRAIALGSVGFCVMTMISLFGFTLFPLSKSNTFFSLADIDSAGVFQDKMHILTVILVIFFTVVSTILYGAGFLKTESGKCIGIVSWCELGLLIAGTISIFVAPKEYFGLAERINIYAIQAYTAILSLWMHKQTRKRG
jgi:hypothetical membrane protein